MNLGELGEFGLIRRIMPHFAVPEGDVLGIGDDCAVLPLGNDRVQLVTTDLLIENIHFLRDRITPEELGHKSLAVNLSDIAAMGGKPTAAFLSIGVPKTLEIEWLDRFFAGIKALASTWDCPLLGGDTTKSSEHIVINFTVLGEAAKAQVKYRSGAKPDDVIAVTGLLGDSSVGLRLLLESQSLETEEQRCLVAAHHQPSPHLAEGQWLATQEAVHAMMDVSDGVDSDIRHIMERSSLGAVIDLEALPISATARKVCAANRWRAEEFAVSGGEDYCLLCTVAADAFPAVSEAYARDFTRPLFAIGKMQYGKELEYRRNGKPTTLVSHGFDHFKVS